MSEIFIYAFFCFFAAYGLIIFLREISYELFKGKPDNSKGIQMVLLVKNHEHDIEGVIRSMLDCRCKNRILADRGLKVIDLGSSDETVGILERLGEDYGSIEVIKAGGSQYEEFKAILDNRAV